MREDLGESELVTITFIWPPHLVKGCVATTGLYILTFFPRLNWVQRLTHQGEKGSFGNLSANCGKFVGLKFNV